MIKNNAVGETKYQVGNCFFHEIIRMRNLETFVETFLSFIVYDSSTYFIIV